MNMIKYTNCSKWVGSILFYLFLVQTPVWASDFWSPRTAALGGAAHAGPILNDSVYLNPSFSAYLPTYSATFNYGFYKGSEETNPASAAAHGMNWNVGIQDGRSELFQAGVAFARRGDARMLHLGASKAVIQQLGVGLGGKFIFPSNGQNQVRDASLSFTGILTDWVQTVVMIDNLFQPDTGRALNFYREFILGIKMNLKGIVMIYFDPHLVPDMPGGLSTFGHELGFEFGIFRDLFLRLGQFRNANVPYLAQYGRGFSLGIGWIGPRISLDYGLSKISDPIPTVAHVFGTTIYF